MANTPAVPQDLSLRAVKDRLFDWKEIILILLVLVLIYQVIVPFAMIVWASFKTVHPGEPSFINFDFSVANYARAFGSKEFWEATRMTLIYATTCTVFAFLGGLFLAWVVTRTNTPGAQFIGMVTLARIVIPTILITVSWILVASPSIGMANKLIIMAGGPARFFNVYTFWGMVWVQWVEIIPLAYLLIMAALQSMDPRLEEASVMTGASTWRTTMRITVPLVTPAVIAAGLLLFITTVENFEVPLLLGGRADVRVYTTEVFFNTARTPTDWGLASTYSMALLVLACALLVIYFYMTRASEKYQTITGKDFRPHRIDLGAWKWLTSGISMLLIFIVTGLPFIVMIYASFLEFLEPPSAEAFRSMSWVNYKNLLGDSHYALNPMINSTLLGVGSATAVMILASTISYYVHKTRVPGRKLLDFLGFASIAIPSVVLGTSFLWLYLLVPVPIIGTLTIIGLAYLTKYLPFALRFVSSSMVQIHVELEEAAIVAGVPWWKNFIQIYLPLLRPGLMAGWFWVMVHAYRELTVALLLSRSENRTAAVIIFDLWDSGSFMQLSAFGVIIFLVLMILVWISHVLSKRFGVQDT